jgi:hypothetical protein
MNEDIVIPPITTTPKQRRPAQARAGIQGLINLALMIWTIWDIRHRSDEEINGRRKLWLLAAFAPPVGPIAYFIFGRKRGVKKDSPPSSSDSTQPTDVTPL